MGELQQVVDSVDGTQLPYLLLVYHGATTFLVALLPLYTSQLWSLSHSCHGEPEPQLNLR
eukprot:scaffold283_cov194-Alexandrium_tamarense.AAC.7